MGEIFVDQGRDGPWGQEDDPDITDHWPAPATQSIGVNKLRSQWTRGETTYVQLGITKHNPSPGRQVLKLRAEPSHAIMPISRVS